MMKNLAAFSGGRSSAYMLRLLLDAGLLPDWVCFQNTGMESPQTYEFIRAVAEQWLAPAGVNFAMLEFCLDETGAQSFRQVGHDELKRNGEVFMSQVETAQAIPNGRARQCTFMMKTEVQNRFARARGIRGAYNSLLGIRHDEPGRVANQMAKNIILQAWMDGRRACLVCEGTGRDMGKECPKCKGSGKMRAVRDKAVKIMPLVERKIERHDVIKFWQGAHGLDLSFDPGDPALHLSNCVGCFHGNEAAVWRTFQEHPRLAAVWEKMEDVAGRVRPRSTEVAEERIIWVHQRLGRDLTPREWQTQTFHRSHSWAEFREFVERCKRGEDMPLFSDAVRPGGCGDGFCGTDL